MTDETDAAVPAEIAAIGAVHAALKALEPEAQSRVLNYVALMLKISPPRPDHPTREHDLTDATEDSPETATDKETASIEEHMEDELEGISTVARKWMARNGLQAKALSSIFSLGVDEIDLVARTVPGSSKKEKMRNVFLLKGAAAYLGTGAARFTHKEVKETCLHYDAFDAANFAAHLKRLSSEVSGSKSAGYTLTTRGLAAATDLLKTMTKSSETA